MESAPAGRYERRRCLQKPGSPPTSSFVHYGVGRYRSTWFAGYVDPKTAHVCLTCTMSRAARAMPQPTIPCNPVQVLDQRMYRLHPYREHAVPCHEMQGNCAAASEYHAGYMRYVCHRAALQHSLKPATNALFWLNRPPPPFRGLSDHLFEQNRAGPSGQQQQLASMLAVVDRHRPDYRVGEIAEHAWRKRGEEGDQPGTPVYVP